MSFTCFLLLFLQADKRSAALEAENTTLKSENAELKARLSQNSKNSSKPPSSEEYQKNPTLPRSKKGKQGGKKVIRGAHCNKWLIPIILSLARLTLKSEKSLLPRFTCWLVHDFISTARKNNRNVFLELCHTFEGHNFITSE